MPLSVHTVSDTDLHIDYIKPVGSPLAFYVTWKISDHTPYTVMYYQEIADCENESPSYDDDSSDYVFYVKETQFGTTFTAPDPVLLNDNAGFTDFTIALNSSPSIDRYGKSVVNAYRDRNTFSIYYDYNGGSDNNSQSDFTVYVKYGNKVPDVVEPEYSPYYFYDWQKDGSTYKVPKKMPAEDLSLLARWACKITYIGRDGSVVKNQLVPVGDIAAYPYDITKAQGKYSFAGFYTDPECTNYFDIYGTPITEDITLYTKWVNYKIFKFYKNDGSEDCCSWDVDPAYSFDMIDYKTAFGEEAPEGKYLLGWARTATAISPDYGIHQRIEHVTDNMDFYAVYTSDYVTLSIVNSYNVSEVITKKMAKNSTCRLYLIDTSEFSAPVSYVRSTGFSSVLNGDVVVWDDTVTLSEDVTYYLNWELWIVVHNGYWNPDGSENTKWYNYKNGIFSRPDDNNLPEKPGSDFIDFYDNPEFSGDPFDFSVERLSQLPGYGDTFEFHIYAKFTDTSVNGPTITIETINSDEDITLTVSGTTFTVSSTLTITSYVWKLDGEVISEATGSSYTYDAASLPGGTHNLSCAVTDSDGNMYSSDAEFTVSN